MTTALQLSSPVFLEWAELGCYDTVHICNFWFAAPYLDKIVWHYLLSSC